MKCFITGGTGLIGQRLIARLLADNHQITLLTRRPSLARRLFADQVHLRQTFSADALNGVQAVINLAGESIASGRWSAARKRRLCQSRWHITEQLAQAINRLPAPPAVFISASAIGYYGDQGEHLITEDTAAHHEFSHQLCQQWEQLAQQASPASRVCLLRTGVVLSPQGGMLARLLPLFRAGLGGHFGDGKHYLAWIHIDDMVSGILWLLNQPLHGAFNFTAPDPVTNACFVKTLARLLSRPAWLPVPAWLLRLALGEAAALILASQRALPQRLLDSGFTFHWPDLQAALRDLLNRA